MISYCLVLILLLIELLSCPGIITYWRRVNLHNGNDVWQAEEFDMATGKDWTQYIERMEYYFQANKITEGDTKRAILISAMGEKAYKLMRGLISPAEPNDISFGQLVKAMRGHLCPPPSEIIQHHKFNSRIQQDGESVAVYVSELKALAQYCNFGETLEVML